MCVPIRSSIAIAVLLVGLGARPFGEVPSPAVEVTFLDVGQGDAILVRSPEGKTALVDAGPDPGIVAQLRAHGVDTLDLVVATHPHADHIGGMAAVLRAIPVRYYMDDGIPHTTATYLELMRTVRASDITYLRPTARAIRLGSVALEVLPPAAGVAADDLNDASVGLVVRLGSFRALLPGDAQVEELNHFLKLGVPRVAVLKAAHHGGRNGVTPAWLAATKPEVVVISCGRDNPYGHPHPRALRYYESAARSVYRTDRDGDVRVVGLSDGTYTVTTTRVRVVVEDGTSTGGGGTAGETGEAAALDGQAGTAAAGRSVKLWVFANAPGNDHYNLNGEYVVISNIGPEPLSLDGWTLCDAARHCYRFPEGASVASGGEDTLFTGSGRSGGTRFYMGSGRAVWNNGGDVATLSDASGRVMATHVY